MVIADIPPSEANPCAQLRSWDLFNGRKKGRGGYQRGEGDRRESEAGASQQGLNWLIRSHN